MFVDFEYDFESTLAALTYLSSQGVPELTKYKLCKLLFLADKYHLVRFGRVITGDRYCALPHGPIPSHTLNVLNAALSGGGTGSLREHAERVSNSLEMDTRYEHPRFSAREAFNRDYLSDSDLMALNHVISEYGNMGFERLKAITHAMFAYRSAWDEKPEGSKRAEMSFENFFEEDAHAVHGARDLMLEDDSLRKALSAR